MLQSFEGCMVTQLHKDNAWQHPNTTHAYTLLPSAGTFHSSLGFKSFLRYWYQGYRLKHQIESFSFNAAAAAENLQKSYNLESFKDPWWLTSNWIIRGVEVIKQSLITISKDFQVLITVLKHSNFQRFEGSVCLISHPKCSFPFASLSSVLPSFY